MPALPRRDQTRSPHATVEAVQHGAPGIVPVAALLWWAVLLGSPVMAFLWGRVRRHRNERWTRAVRMLRLRPPGVVSGTLAAGTVLYADALLRDLGATLTGLALSVVTVGAWLLGLGSPAHLDSPLWGVGIAMVPLLAVVGFAAAHTDAPTRAVFAVSRPWLERAAAYSSDGHRLAGLVPVSSATRDGPAVYLRVETAFTLFTPCGFLRLDAAADPDVLPPDTGHLHGRWYTYCLSGED